MIIGLTPNNTGSVWMAQTVKHHLREVPAGSIISIHGYAIGDVAWHRQNYSSLRSHTRKVFLPQSFGPFDATGDYFRQNMEIFESSLIFAREDSSAQHLQNLFPHLQIHQSPDIVFAHPMMPTGIRQKPRRVAIIPNAHCLSFDATYLDSLTAAAAFLISRGYEVSAYAHTSSRKDLGLFHQWKAPSQMKKLVISSHSSLMHLPLQYDFGICSRYHAVVAYLRAGIPCLAYGWSHKYQALMDLFHVPEYAVDHQTLIPRLGALTDPTEHARFCSGIANRLSHVRQSSLATLQKAKEFLSHV